MIYVLSSVWFSIYRFVQPHICEIGHIILPGLLFKYRRKIRRTQMQAAAQHLNLQFRIRIILPDIFFCFLNNVDRHILSALNKLHVDLTA